MKFCELCLENNKLSICSVFDCNNKELDAVALIEKYFPIKIFKTSLICSECWEHIESFHKFCLRVSEIHNFIKPEKADDTNDNILENSKSPTPDLTSEFIVKQEDNEFIVKQEDDANKAIKNNNPFFESDDQSDDNIENENNSPTSPFDKTKETEDDTEPYDTPKEPIELLPEHLKVNREIGVDIDKKLAKLINRACPICAKVQPSFREVIRHVVHVHKTRGYALCCNVKLYDRNYALKHLNRWHTRVSDKYKCKECGKQLANFRNLKMHRLNRHKINIRELFPCELCPTVSFSRKEKLKMHHREVHDKKEYECSECKKVFSNNKNLRAHSKRHSTNTDHVGDICGTTYKTKDSFESHHTQMDLDIVKPKQKSAQPKQKFAHEEKKFECKICKNLFRTTDLLREHFATHAGTTLYQCPYCMSTYKHAGNYYKHRRKLHNAEWLKNKKQIVQLTLNYL